MLAIVVVCLAVVAAAAGSSYAHPARPAASAKKPATAAQAPETAGESTLEQTITGSDPREAFSFLRLGPGEGHVVREDLAKARMGRAHRRRSLLYMAQLTDFQLSDEESPARVEFLDDAIESVASSAWRPQEALVAHQVEYTIRQVNRFLDSPVTQGDGSRARMLNAVLTGDQADNAQFNETEWVVRLLEGGTLDPNSGSRDVENDYDAFCQSQVTAGALDPAEAPNYTGVQDYDDYFKSPVFYDPEEPLGIYAARNWPTYTGLMDRAQKPFTAEGLRVPSYAAFGNHDSLAQGNEAPNAAFEAVGIGCVKPLAPIPSLGNPLDNLDPAYLEGVANDPLKAMLVPPDPDRRYVDKRQFKALHDTGKQADAHGFAYIDADELQASNGAASYYSFAPKQGVRYIVLDTVADAGTTADVARGNIDDPQWRWLAGELDRAQQANELILVFGHHATGSLVATTPDERAPPCTVDDSHGHDLNPGCDRDPRASTPLHNGAELEQVFHRHPNVIAYVAGHSHENRVTPKKSDTGGDFWEIKSPAVVDWPPQHRLIEVMDNRDGTLSIFGTMLDHASPVAAPTGGDAAGFDDMSLASIGRTLTYNDPQAGPGTDGELGPEGAPTDRNVELLLKDPRARAAAEKPAQATPAPAHDAKPPAADPGHADRADENATRTGAPAAGGGLPFTGLGLLALAVLGLLMAAGGLLAGRRLSAAD